MTRPSRSGRPARSGASGAASASTDRRQRAVGPARGEGRAERKGGGRGSEAAALLRDWISRPLFDYHVLLAITALLTGIGLVMVLSSSMASSGNEGSVWGVFIRQAAMVAVGLFMFWVVMRVRIEMVRKLAPLGL
ncbi:MAG: FtsW/RodA/SpoVE family cell cycle protein, partial [Corynebacterium sp.]|nr:FtsW/RodA/SpoVE family cell cycle protein [Corynebacterium sp.]